MNRRPKSNISEIMPELPTTASIKRALYRKSFRSFVLGMNDQYKPSWHHEIIIKELENLIYGDVDKLILTMPPRHGKSELASRMLPAWLFARNPDINIIAASYSGELAEAMCRDVQLMMTSPQYVSIFPESALNTKLRAYNTRKDGTVARGIRRSDYFEIPYGKGSYRCAGIGGSITGMGGNVLILDDPVRNSEDAASPSISDKSWDWFGSTFLTRQAPNSKILVIQTRWSMKDITGRILSSDDAWNWRVISFPAIQYENPYRHEMDNREEGEVLWPDRFSLSELNKIRPLLSKRDWNCLYQCNPIPEAGNIISPKDFKIFTADELPERFTKVIQSWDLAFGDTGDYVAGLVIGQIENRYYLLDLFHKKVPFSRTISAIKVMNEKYPSTSKIFIEKSANGFAAIDVLSKEFRGIVPVVAKGDKVARVDSIVHLIENGLVYLPKSASWVDEFLAECSQFPNGIHDDMVDAMSQGLGQLINSKGLSSFMKAFNS